MYNSLRNTITFVILSTIQSSLTMFKSVVCTKRKGPFTPRESERESLKAKENKEIFTNIKEIFRFRFRLVWMDLNNDDHR